jgi:mannosyl-3-phosphoglycerate phosphatase
VTVGQVPQPSEVLIATDLDGCLLDELTYEFAAAEPALASLKARGVALVLASSKTRSEMEALSDVIGATAALVVENGGALLVPKGRATSQPGGAALIGGFWTIVLGGKRPELRAALASIARQTGATLRSLLDMTPEEVARITGLSVAGAERARDRRYDVPFLIEDPSRAHEISAKARTRGLQVTRGGRFWNLTSGTDKGRALRVFLGIEAAEGRRYVVLALGDAPNDLTMLQAADRPIVMPRRDGTLDEVLRDALPAAERAPAPGPAGWNSAVLAVLNGQNLPRVADSPA